MSFMDSQLRKRSLDGYPVVDTVEGHGDTRRTRSMRKASLASDVSYAESTSSSSQRKARRSRVTSTSTDDGDGMRLTKTGRVSRALKGQPVHQCDICDKVSPTTPRTHPPSCPL